MKPEDVTPILNSFEVYLKSTRAMPDTIKTYMSVAKAFLLAQNELTEETFRAFLANSYNFKNSTARKYYYSLLALFKSRGIAVTIEPPAIDSEPSRLVISPDDMNRVILATKAGGNATERGLLALSSIYGLRRKELRYLKRTDIDYDKKTITIRAVKHGRTRPHIIPDCIYDYVINYDFKLKSDVEFAAIFWEIIKKAGLTLAPGYGWHSIRRALYTGFVINGVDWYLRYEFMRWRMVGGFNNTGMDAVYTRMLPEMIDKMIFEKHPFLKSWQ